MITKVRLSQQMNSFAKLHLTNTISKGERRNRKERVATRKYWDSGLE